MKRSIPTNNKLRYVAIALLSSLLFISGINIAYASASHIPSHHENHMMDCQDGACTESSSQSCIEHCLQNVTPHQYVLAPSSEFQITKKLSQKHFIAHVAPKNLLAPISRARIKDGSSRHLKTQKRE
jgi:hypothetical protein